MNADKQPTVLIVEDGDEYRDNLTRFVPGPAYEQAHSAAEALTALSLGGVDLIYLDMRFDRVPRSDLIGDHAALTRELNDDPERAWKHLAVNQGLYVLRAVRDAGHATVPVILAYDFSREPQRWKNLAAIDPYLDWVPDAVTAEQIRAKMAALTAAKPPSQTVRPE